MREYYERVAGLVCRYTGFPIGEVLKGRSVMQTDARSLLLHFLARRMTNMEIVHLTGLSKQAVSQLINRHADRKRFKDSLRAGERAIRTELEAMEE